MACPGWRLTALVRLVIEAFLALHFGISGWTAAIHASDRSSLVLFSMTFVTLSLQRLCPSSLSQWMLQNTCSIGLSFAFSHAIHLGLIIAMSLDFPDPFLSEQPGGKWLFGEVEYMIAGPSARPFLRPKNPTRLLKAPTQA